MMGLCTDRCTGNSHEIIPKQSVASAREGYACWHYLSLGGFRGVEKVASCLFFLTSKSALDLWKSTPILTKNKLLFPY